MRSAMNDEDFICDLASLSISWRAKTCLGWLLRVISSSLCKAYRLFLLRVESSATDRCIIDLSGKRVIDSEKGLNALTEVDASGNWFMLMMLMP